MKQSERLSLRFILVIVGFINLLGCSIDVSLVGEPQLSSKATIEVQLTSTALSPNNLASIPVTIDFGSMSVTGLDVSDFNVVNGTATNLSGSGATYTLDLVPSGTGNFTVSIQLAEFTVTSVNGDPNAASNILTFTMDLAPPTLAIVGPAIAGGDVSTSFVYTVNYTDAAVVDLDDLDITLGGTDTAGCTKAVTGVGTSTRTVTVTGCTGDGPVTISIAADSARDALGNQALAAGPSSAAQVRNSLIVKIDTTLLSGGSPNDTVVIPLANWTAYNFEVNWGDNTASQPVVVAVSDGGGSNRTVSHLYTVPGIYSIKIRGSLIPSIPFCAQADKLKILDIEQWGPITWYSMEGMFSGCENVQISATDAPDLSNVTNLKSMFAGAVAFNSPIGHWDTSNVTETHSMFLGAVAFNQPIGTWDMSSLTDMTAMFAGATNFNQPIGTWNVSNVTAMSWVFYDARSFNQNIGSWNTANVRDMESMFASAESFNQPIGSWNTANVESMYHMFDYALAFNQPINKGTGGIWNTSKVQNMEGMFYRAESFNQNIGDWDTSAVTTMKNMFAAAKDFNGSLSNWNTANVEDMSFMFRGAIAFNQPINKGAGSIWDTSKVKDMSHLFDGAIAFNQNIGAWNTASVLNMESMFRQAEAFDQDIGPWNTSAVTNMNYLLQDAIAFNRNLSGWSVGSVATSLDYSTGAGSWAPGNKPALP